MLDSKFQIVLMLISMAGVWLNIKKRREGFLIWSFTNAVWAYIDFKSGLPAQGTLFLVYLILSILGWFQWGEVKDEAIYTVNGIQFKVVPFMGSHWWTIKRKELFFWKQMRHEDFCTCLGMDENPPVRFMSKEEAKDWLAKSIIVK